MFTAVIPTLNEESTIAGVVQMISASPLVQEVLVIDDGSTDATAHNASRAGARVLRSTMLGKGASLADGVREASAPYVLFVDGDLTELAPDLVEKMAQPLLGHRAELVKASFTRQAGRVTTLTAKPLLHTFFPELDRLEQPLSGICAASRELLRQLSFEDDYGVDVGLLIDAQQAGARIEEVHIGHLDHDSHTLEALGSMAHQVVRVILDRAARYGRMTGGQLLDGREEHRITEAGFSVLRSRIKPGADVVLLPMDQVLLQGCYIEELAARTGRLAELRRMQRKTHAIAAVRSRDIARVFTGVPKFEFETTAREMPLATDAVETVLSLRRAGWQVGVLEHLFFIATEIVRRRVFADFSVANLTYFNNNVSTGELVYAPALAHPAVCRHAYCKANLLGHLSGIFRVPAARVAAVGLNADDHCLLRRVGYPVATAHSSQRVRKMPQWQKITEMSQLPALIPHWEYIDTGSRL